MHCSTDGLEWGAVVAVTSPQYVGQLERILSDPLQWHRDVFGHDVYID